MNNLDSWRLKRISAGGHTMRPEENIHNALIRALVEKKEEEGHTVWADHIGNPNGAPSEYGGHIADMLFKKNGEYEYCEAETTRTLNTEHTKRQWAAFSSRPNVAFSVIVPKAALSDAEYLAKLWGIKVKTFWSMEV